MNKNNGTAFGVSNTSGFVGGAYSFDGTTGSYVNGSANNFLNGSSSVGRTVEAWFNKKGPGQYRIAGVFQASGSYLPQYSLMVVDTNALRVQLRNSSGDFYCDGLSSVNFSLNEWHHGAWTYDGSALRFYLDGLPAGNFSCPGSIRGDSAPSFYIGARGDRTSSEMFNGTIDEVAIYNRTLSAAEILAHAGAKSIGKYGKAVSFDGVSD
jgi:hypothetical protein